MILPLALTIMIVIFVNLGDVASEGRTCYYDPPPNPSPGEHWMQAAVRQIRKRCPAQQSCSKAAFVCLADGPLGMEDGRITDSALKASTVFPGSNYGAKQARLNLATIPAAWVANSGDASPWIQVTFDTEVYVTGLITQGRGDWYQWVESYQVRYSHDGLVWRNVTDSNGAAKTFIGNTDQQSLVTVKFPAVLQATLIRILPKSWDNHCCMRFEVLGCYP